MQICGRPIAMSEAGLWWVILYSSPTPTPNHYYYSEAKSSKREANSSYVLPGGQAPDVERGTDHGNIVNSQQQEVRSDRIHCKKN